MMIRFTLPIVPTAQARPRVAVRGRFAQAYKTQTQQANERTLEAMLFPHRPKIALEGGIQLSFVACFLCPRSAPKKTREGMLCGKICHTVKPDLDNLAKQLKDAMTRMNFWKDDKQVVRMIAEKRYAENPGWIVELKIVGMER